MKAFAVSTYGPDGLAATDLPTPVTGPKDVLVRIHASSVNPLDTMVRNGTFKALLPYRLPFVLGHDLAGTVEAVGHDVAGFHVGDVVYARPRDLRIGAFAEYLAVDAGDVAVKPAALSLTEAAAVPLVALASWQALHDVAQVQQGQRVLIHGGAGGLGSTAIQIAKYLGAEVFTTARASDEARLRDWGADHVLDYTTTDFSTVLADLDVVLDSRGGDTLTKSLSVLRPGGIAISVVGPPDPAFAHQIGKPWLKPILWFASRKVRAAAKRRNVRYAFLFMQASGEQLALLARLYDAGNLRPVIDRVFPFDQTLEAIAYVEQGNAKGKVVLQHLPTF